MEKFKKGELVRVAGDGRVGLVWEISLLGKVVVVHGEARNRRERRSMVRKYNPDKLERIEK